MGWCDITSSHMELSRVRVYGIDSLSIVLKKKYRLVLSVLNYSGSF